MLLFLVTPWLVVAVQLCMECIPIINNNNEKNIGYWLDMCVWLDLSAFDIQKQSFTYDLLTRCS